VIDALKAMGIDCQGYPDHQLQHLPAAAVQPFGRAAGNPLCSGQHRIRHAA
jgi:hypothetical protein